MAHFRFRKRDVALDQVPIVLEIVKIVAEAAPVPCLGLVADGLSSIVERVQEVRTNSEDARAFLEKSQKLDAAVVSMVSDANAALDASGRFTLQERLEKLLGALTEARISAEKLRGGAGFWGAFEGVIYAKRNEAVLKDLNEQITTAVILFKFQGQVAVEIEICNVRHDAKITKNVVINTERIVGAVGHGVEEIRHSIKNVWTTIINTGAMVGNIGREIKIVQHTMLTADEERLLNSIPHAHAGYQAVDELKSGFLQGTREELFGDLDIWICQRPPPPPEILQQLYLLSGGAGLGKSSVAHQLCVRIAERRRMNLGASFFFVRGGGDLESARSFFSTIAHQLALSQPILRPYISSAVPAFLKDGEQQQMLRTFEGLLWNPLTQFASSTSGLDQPITFIVIDGLDECKDRALVPELLRCLIRLVRAFSWLRIFVAARPEPHIIPSLTSSSSSDIVHHVSLNETFNEWRDDVDKYLRATVPQLESCREYVRINPDKLNQLISRAGGVFIYARVAVNFLEAFNDNPEEVFTLLLGARESELPPIDNLYLQVLRLAFPAEYLRIMPERAERLRRLLTFLALRRSDLSPTATALLLGLSKDNVVQMVDRLRSVLLVNEDGKVVPLHATFAEFLMDASRCIDPVFHIERASGHALLVSRCFATFSFEIVEAFLASARDGTNEGLQSCVRYTFHWDDHLKSAKYSTELSQQLQTLVNVQIPMFTRLHGKFARHREALTAFLELSGDPTAIFAEYIKFNEYCYDWWWARIRRDYDGSPRAVDTDSGVTDDPVKVSEYLNKELRANETGHTVSSEDLIRYGAVMEDFVMRIRSSGSEALWYDRKLAAGWASTFESW
ncbi:AAA-16 domain-containing protein [Phanerochaete sordida]|uniref:AAA-16 domain-containing protein n=1 Tax=Phanerochaete sordida TaxID=48140 RepID=A0A9P3GFD0_9APHY|nr:AAA-16 domain-containing protein [Phanerochaete sordida]